MKKVSLLIIILCLFITGCGKKEVVVKNWQTTITTKESLMSEEIKSIFNRATSGKPYKALALLATQVVAGSNYMYLALEDNASYKIIAIHNNLSNEASIMTVSDFDYTKYTFENFEYQNQTLSGGWNVYTSPMLSSTKNNVLDGDVLRVFESATKNLVGAVYLPIANLGYLDEDGTKYAILCYGELATANNDEGIFLVTLYNTGNTNEIISSAYVNLGDFNK